MRIGIVGGAERAEPQLKRIAEQAGHQLEFHPGHMSSCGAAALEALVKNFKDSTLRDDALFRLAQVHHEQHHNAEACAAIARLRKDFPASNQLRKAEELSTTLHCR